MRGIRLIFFILLCLSYSMVLFAEPPEFAHISIEEGLPGSNIRKIYQDSYGYLWIGIEAAGLCRYDGKKYEVYENIPNDSLSLSNNFVWNIVEDKHKNLWLATENGLNFFLRNKRKFFTFFPNQEYYNEFNNNKILSLLIDDNGNLWIGHTKGIHILYKKEFDKFYSLIKKDEESAINFFSKLKLNSVFKNLYSSISVRSISLIDNTVWACTSNGLYSFDQDGNILKYYKSSGNSDKLIDDYVYFIKDIGNHYYLVGTDRGINKFYPDKDQFEILSFDYILEGELNYKAFIDAEIDEKGRIWLAHSEGLLVGDKTNKGKYRYDYIAEGDVYLNSNIIRDVTISREGIVWIGTKFGGLNIHNINEQIFPHITSPIEDFNNLNSESSFILSCYEDEENNIWLGSKFGGLLLFNKEKNTLENIFTSFENTDEVFSSRVETIYKLKDGNLISGNPRGVTIYNLKKRVIKHIDFKMVTQIIRDNEGLLWLGTVNGIYLFDENTYTPYSYEKFNPSVFFANKNLDISNIYIDKFHKIWFGTRENGIYIFDKKRGVVNHKYHDPKNKQSLSGDMVRGINEDDSGRVWIAIKHEGLCCYDTLNDNFKHFTKLDGLPSNTIYAILKDDNGNLWLSTHHGISKMNIKDFTFSNYDISHGLQDNIFENNTKLKLSTGELIFGGKNGFNIFHPDSIKTRNYNAPLIITDFNINDELFLSEICEDTTVKLKYHQNFLSFEFALLDFRNPEKTRYKYILEGIDNEWIESGERNYVSYPKLPGGKYTFKLMALDQDNNWTKTLSIPILIKPPIWGTTIAYVIYIILFISILIFFYKFATIRVSYVHRLNEAKTQIQHTMDLNRSKLQFFTNISHELKTPLSLIMAPLENLMKSIDIPEKNKKDLDLLHRNTIRLNNLINQLLYFRKTEHKSSEMKVTEGNIVSFVKEVVFPYYELAAKQKIVFNIISQSDNIKLWFDPDKIEKIISNLLMNAFTYTAEGGKIWIEISYDIFDDGEFSFEKTIKQKKSEKVLKISVCDTGIGMTLEQTKNIFDRFYVADDHKKGIGIGLELSRTLVELHGGKIAVESESGKGSKFHIWLRIGKDHYKKEYISEKQIVPKEYVKDIDQEFLLTELGLKEERENTDVKSGKIPIILIVEDNNDLRYFLNSNLSDQYKVITVENGIEGLKVAKDKMPDIIISDIMMPEMDGIEMCSKIKSDMTTSHIPVILLTAKTQIENKLEGMAMGADDYIEKPFNLEFLQLRIKNLLTSQKKLKDQIIKSITGEVNNDLNISEYDQNFLDKCKQAIENNFSDPKFSVVELSKFVGMSRSQVHRKLKALTDNSPVEWIYNFRLIKARKLLIEKKYNVSDVAYMTGFNSPSSFSTVFKKKFGLSPSDVLEKNNVI